MTSRRKGRDATAKGFTSATLPATMVVTKIPAPVDGWKETEILKMVSEHFLKDSELLKGFVVTSFFF